MDLGAPSMIWQRSDDHSSVLQDAFDRAGMGDERAEQAFRLQLSLIIDGLAALLSEDLAAGTTVPSAVRPAGDPSWVIRLGDTARCAGPEPRCML